MKEYNLEGAWTKLFRVKKPESVESLDFMRHLLYSLDRSKILLEINIGKLMWFDLVSKSFETLGIKDCDGSFSAELLVSSLVLGSKGDPRRAREKKMMQKSNKRLKMVKCIKDLMVRSQGGWFSFQGIQAEVVSEAGELRIPNLHQGGGEGGKEMAFSNLIKS